MDFTKKENRWLYYIIRYGVISASILVMFTSLKSCYEQRQDRKEIIKNKAFTRGKIVKYGHSGIADHYVDFIYEVNGVTYRNGQAGISLPCASNFNYKGCIGAEYWVIYSKKNPEKSRLLATAHMYEIYELKVPKKIRLN